MSLTEKRPISPTKGEIRGVINKSLGIKEKKPIEEAYVAQPKSYDHPTELLSEKAKKLHRVLYERYVESLNSVSAHLDAIDRKAADSNGSAYRSLKLDECYLLNAVWLHELFFANMSDVHSEIMGDSLPYMRLERDWGTFEGWQWDFIACARSARSGWAVCGYHIYLQRYVNIFIDGHGGHVPMGVYPVLVLDCWEHAYTCDYLDQKDDYVFGQMQEVDWDIVANRFKKAEKMAQVLK